MTNDQTMLSLQAVNLVYRSRPALRQLDWELRAGQHWACVGPNGAGKTSLARVLSHQANHFSGDYLSAPALEQDGVAYVCFEQAQALCARDRKLDDSEYRADAADPGTRVRDAILGGREPDQRFHAWVSRLRLGHILDRGLRFISTGEMRKTLLVRALLSQPALLILDSPLDGLDRASQQAMQVAIDELLAGERSLLLLCRQLEDVPAGISHLLVLDEGRVLCSGEREAVLAREEVQALMRPTLPPLGALPAPTLRSYSVPEGPLLDLRNVSVAYGELQVLRGLDWRLERGQHCCVSGPNGCGKTTLLSLITGDNHKAYGQDITLFGRKRGSGESIWEIKQKYGQLDTQLQLNFARNMKVVEVVVSGFFDSVGLFDDWGDVQRRSAEQWLAALGLGAHVRDSFDTLSFGLQRMVLLARAMVKSPLILLLDEPTLGLDGAHRRLLLKAVDHIAANSDTQVIFVSHSAGDNPACINQQLRFEPDSDGFQVVCENL
ncbi:ATP-binding cassette domain-containing protein [Haliea sp. E1-2-M8]|uniref:ATP-binding cassette domain-containing protein n=1 Tax=Haliea sp. E1-2-M8 TaxID=3064706 RepID=UPI002723C4AB|nr:ATP-binding cassette domain-containing protein [Haliea sp. E1-2-M8]MDO8863860.1 ATP-binding cassette domain-containing protein [Haliea sp. E1-2-M8]